MHKEYYDYFYEKKRYLAQFKEYTELLKRIDYYAEFLDSLFYDGSQFYKLCVYLDDDNEAKKNNSTVKTILLDTKILLQSVFCSLYSFRNCIEVFNNGDSQMIFRKLIDDFLLFLYFTEIAKTNVDIEMCDINSKEYSKKIVQVSNWKQEKFNEIFYANSAFKELIQKNKHLRTVNQSTKFYKELQNTREELNDYTHSNGVKFLNKQNIYTNPKVIIDELNTLIDTINYTLSLLIAILFIISPTHLLSSDYVEFAENNTTFVSSDEISIAPYILDFIKDETLNVNQSIFDYLIKLYSINLDR